MNIGIIGCGHMGSAIAKALMKKKIGKVFVSSPHRPAFFVPWTIDNRQVTKRADILIIAIKPALVMPVLHEISPKLKLNKIIISIAAGIPLKKLYLWSGKHKKIVRVLPNLPAQVFEGVSIWKASPHITKSDKTIVAKLLNSFGISLEVRSENFIDSGCAVSGCGPAFCAAFLETFFVFLKKSGFSLKQSRELALQTALGSINYMRETCVNFSALVYAVATKGGVTETAFKVLKKKKWQKILGQALEAAYRRMQELGTS